MDGELIRAAEQDWRDQTRARMLRADLDLLTEKYPEDMRSFLTRHFDLRIVEDAATNSMVFLTRINNAAEAAEDKLTQILGRIEEAMKRLDVIEMRVGKAAAAFTELSRRYYRLAGTKPAARNGVATVRK